MKDFLHPPYNRFGFAFRFFRIWKVLSGRSRSLGDSQTPATIVAAIEPARYTISNKMKPHVEKSTTSRQQLEVCVAGMSYLTLLLGVVPVVESS